METLEHAVLRTVDSLSSLSGLSVHDNVVDGVTALAGQGRRLVPLSNGGTAVAESRYAAAGIRDRFEHLLTVEDAQRWKSDQEACH